MSLKLELEKEEGRYKLRIKSEYEDNIFYARDLRKFLQFILENSLYYLERRSKYYKGEGYGRVDLRLNQEDE